MAELRCVHNMKDGEEELYDYYYEPDRHGEPDFDRPIFVSKKEFIADNDPQSLADVYTDFHSFGGIEFLVFRGRLSSAVFIYLSAKRAIAEVEAKLRASLEDGSYIVAGYQAESGAILSENIGTVEDAYRISMGATTVTAVAALEGLLIDLTPDSETRPEGLSRLLQAFIKRNDVPKSQANDIREMGQRIGRRRNVFAHTLTGSYFDKDNVITAMFTEEETDDTLYAVGAIAVLIERIESPS